MAAVAESSIRVAIGKDGICAHLIVADVDRRLVTRQNILASLQALGIPAGEEMMALIQKIDEQARTGQLSDQPILLAQGIPPVAGSAACFALSPELTGEAEHPGDGDENRTNFYRSQILTVPADVVIGTLTPTVTPTPGLDVFGKPVHPPPLLRSVQLGKNVRFGADGCSVVAIVAGKVHLTRCEVGIVPVVEIEADVDFSTGNIDATSDVLIGGTVRDSFQVKSAASITIRGAIEAAEIQAGADLQVNGGIAARGQGRVIVGGEVCTKFCNEAHVEATGDITILREAMASVLRTKGRLLIEHGKLIGGHAYARDGAMVTQIGNEANVKTLLAVGVDPLTLAEAARANQDIAKKQEAIAKIRQNVQPLMAQLKRLTPAQRERATELLYQADAMKQEIKNQQEKTSAALHATGTDGREVSVIVQKMAYPGVSLVFGDRIAHLHKEHKGPFKVVRCLHNRAEEILLIDKISGSISVLGAREYDAKAIEADFGKPSGT